MGNTRYDAAWTLHEAVEFVQGLVHPLEIRGFAVGLTGSVLTKGSSMHDLDIIVYPLRSTPATNIEDAKSALQDAGMRCHIRSETLKEVWKRKGSLDEKEVEVWRFKEKRVDVFFLK
jgi:hypothetical protein